MKRYSLFFFFLLGAFLGKAQIMPALKGSPQPRQAIGMILKNSGAVVAEPLLLIQAQETTLSDLIVHPKDLAITQMYHDSTLLASFSGLGRNGVVVAELKSKRPLFRLDHVLDYFHVPAEKRTLKVLVNKQPVNATLLLADVKQIEKIEVTRQDLTNPVRISWNENEEYLNIVTVK